MKVFFVIFTIGFILAANVVRADDSFYVPFDKNNKAVDFESQPAPRAPAALGDANSITRADVTDEFSIHRQDPLQVLEDIPEGEETLSRSWMEYKVGQELESTHN